MNIGKINNEIEKTREKVALWQARLKELEKQKIEMENTQILQAVRNFIVSPEDLQEVLQKLRAGQVPEQKSKKAEEQGAVENEKL